MIDRLLIVAEPWASLLVDPVLALRRRPGIRIVTLVEDAKGEML